MEIMEDEFNLTRKLKPEFKFKARVAGKSLWVRATAAALARGPVLRRRGPAHWSCSESERPRPAIIPVPRCAWHCRRASLSALTWPGESA
jgi:hypothetical protein